MATSGNFTGSTSNRYITPKIEWGAAQSTSGNYSDVTADLYYKKSSSSTASTSGTLKTTLTINGKKSDVVSTSVTLKPNDTYQKVMSFTVRVPHNTDGSKSVTISCTGYISGTSLESTTCKKTVDLTTIKRASTISVTSANVGEVATIAIKRASSAFTHTLTYSFGSLTGTIVENTIETSVKWNVPTSFYNQMAVEKSKSGTITCVTYSGDTEIGSSTATFTVTVSDENAPALNPKVYVSDASDTYKLTGSTTKLIRYFTWAIYEINATAKNGASIVSQSVKNGDSTYTDATAQLQKAIVDGKFIFSATDSRGYTTSQEYVVDLVDYVKLTCVLKTSVSSDGTLSVSIEGKYFNGSFGAIENELQVAFKYKQGNEDYSEWVYVTPSINGNSYKGTMAISGLDYKEMISVQAWAGDALYSNGLNEGMYTNTVNIRAYPLFDWGEGDFNFNIPVVAPSVNGMYVKNVQVNGTDSFQMQTRFSNLSGNGNSRHAFHIFGSANYQPIQGVLTVGNAGRCVWEGTSGVTAAAVDASNSGAVEITLPYTAYDTFAIMSVYEFDATA